MNYSLFFCLIQKFLFYFLFLNTLHFMFDRYPGSVRPRKVKRMYIPELHEDYLFSAVNPAYLYSSLACA